MGALPEEGCAEAQGPGRASAQRTIPRANRSLIAILPLLKRAALLLRKLEYPNRRASVRGAAQLRHERRVARRVEPALTGDDRDVLLVAYAKGDRARARHVV